MNRSPQITIGYLLKDNWEDFESKSSGWLVKIRR